MRQIWKFELQLVTGEIQSIAMPGGAIPLTVQMQNGKPVLWATVETESPPAEQKFYLAWTGKPLIPQPLYDAYIGTFQTNDGMLVWHLFQIVED